MNRPVYWLVLRAGQPERVFPCDLENAADAAELDRLYGDERTQLVRVPLHSAAATAAKGGRRHA